MDFFAEARNRRASTLAMLTYLFVLLMAVAMVQAYQSVFDFQKTAMKMTEAVKAGEIFKKDYLLALYAPATSIKVCHTILRKEPCIMQLSVPESARNIPPDAVGKYAPALVIGIEDPPWNATVRLDVTVYGKTGQTGLDLIEPTMTLADCKTEAIDSISYKTCKLSCSSAVKITKKRELDATIGGGAIIDKVSIEQGVEGC